MEERVNTGAPPFLLSTWHLDTFPMPLAFYLKYKPVSWSSAGKPLFSSYKIWKHCSKILITSYTLQTPKYTSLLQPSDLPVVASRTQLINYLLSISIGCLTCLSSNYIHFFINLVLFQSNLISSVYAKPEIQELHVNFSLCFFAPTSITNCLLPRTSDTHPLCCQHFCPRLSKFFS